MRGRAAAQEHVHPLAEMLAFVDMLPPKGTTVSARTKAGGGKKEERTGRHRGEPAQRSCALAMGEARTKEDHLG